MSEPRWTPGPWRINKYGSVGAGDSGHEPIVAHVEPFYGEDQKFGSHCANASLIAASPEQAAVIEKGIALIERIIPMGRWREVDEWLSEARSVRAKSRAYE